MTINVVEVEKLKRQTERHIERYTERLEALQEKEKVLSVHGHWELGYYRGTVSALENVVDKLEVILEDSN